MVARRSDCDVMRINDVVDGWLDESLSNTAQRTNADSGHQSGVSEVLCVFDLAREELSVVNVRRAGHRSLPARKVGRLLKFTEWKFAPCRARELQLVTPEGYRREEGSGPGVADRLDGCLTKDATPWMKETVLRGEYLPLGSVRSFKATMTFLSPEEPWIYCTSIRPEDAAAMRTLTAEFPQYDAATEIADPAEFARQLGIDFALGLDADQDVVVTPLQDLVYARSSYSVSFWEGRRQVDKIVNVYHGPVRYEDQSGVLQSLEDVVDLRGAQRAWFTKRTKFSGQREYRFAVSTLGIPRDSKKMLAVSDEIRKLTTEVWTDLASHPALPRLTRA